MGSCVYGIYGYTMVLGLGSGWIGYIWVSGVGMGMGMGSHG